MRNAPTGEQGFYAPPVVCGGVCTGNVTVTSDAAMLAWAAQRCSSVVGSLTISTPVSSVYLPCLGSVTGNLSVINNASLVSFSAPALNTVGGYFNFNTLAALTSLTVPTLARVGDYFQVNATAVTSLTLPALSSVVSNVWVGTNSALTSVSMPVFLVAGGSVTFVNNALTTINLPIRTIAVTLLVYPSSSLVALSLPDLLSVGLNFHAYSDANLTTISVPSLVTVGGDFSVSSNAKLVTLTTTSLTAITGTLYAQSDPALLAINMPVLASVAAVYGYLDTVLANVSMPLLCTVSGALMLYSNAALPQCQVDAIKNGITSGPSSYTLTGNNGAPNICASKSLEFAPADGGGMGVLCACAETTGSQGERGQFTRASTATCSKSASFTEFAVSDVVTCAADKPLTRYAGTSGYLGGLWEQATTEQLIRTNEFATSPWTVYAIDSGTPVVYATDGGAAYNSPLGAQTAFRVDIPSCAGDAGAAYFGQSFTATASVPHSCSLYAKSATGSKLALFNYAANPTIGNETVCSMNVDGGWSRCEHNWNQAANTTGNFGFGCQADNGYAGRSEEPVGTFFIAGANCTPEPRMSSYVAATSAIVVRAASQPFYLNGAISSTTVNVAATVTPEYLKTGSVYARIGLSATDNLKMTVESNKATCTLIGVDAGVTVNASVAGMTIRTPNRIVCKVDGANLTTCLEGTCATVSAGTLSGTARNIYLGTQDTDGSEANAVIDLVCVAADGGCAL